MKKFLLSILLLIPFAKIFANHISGGEFYYEFISQTATTKTYKVTIRLFRDCNSTGATLQSETPDIGVYNTASGVSVLTTTLSSPTVTTIQLNTAAIPCLTNAPDVCFQVGLYTATITLPDNAEGYTLVWIRCCRADVNNLSPGTGAGSSLVATIPGTNSLPIGHNSSPQFLLKDTALVCQLKPFQLDFGAIDSDNDSLSYQFCAAYNGGTSSAPNPGPSGSLSLSTLNYQSPFSGSSPLGTAVSIDPKTGKITGTAPAQGRYVISVCVTEWRNGKAFNVHRKDFILQVGNCNYAAADPLPQVGEPSVPQFDYEFISCRSFTVHFRNGSNSSIITSYHWDFGVDTTNKDTSILATPSYTYPDSGTFTIKLIVSGSNRCIDSNSVTIGIYPGMKGGFQWSGSCYKKPFIFTDTSKTTYGTINTWRWDFGDLSTAADTSHIQNPTYIYPNKGIRNAMLYVTDSKGCADTVTTQVVVLDIPSLVLPFHDTVICSIDTLQLVSQGSGVFAWSPPYNLINPSSATPLVYPKQTTTYSVSLTDFGCVANDTIRVNVVDTISVYAGRDTIICRNDLIQFFPISEGLKYLWSPAFAVFSKVTDKDAVVSPPFDASVRTDTTIIYTVLASTGGCTATDQVVVKAVRYPVVNAGPNKSICFGTSTQLSGSIQAAAFEWFPTNSLTNAETLTPSASPRGTTTYFLTATDTIGCPKPNTDTVLVTVIPVVKVFAGHDTNIVYNQSLHLFANINVDTASFIWSPPTGLNNQLIQSPTATLQDFLGSITYKVMATTPEGCMGDDDIKVTVFKTAPDIYVPSGFSPNGDGKNDVLKPILVGLQGLDYFRVYNRWGQLVYSTASVGEGWDGTLGGFGQASGTYVYMAQATDFTGKTVFRKGTVVLVR